MCHAGLMAATGVAPKRVLERVPDAMANCRFRFFN
jgi:hypothetical protein